MRASVQSLQVFTPLPGFCASHPPKEKEPGLKAGLGRIRVAGFRPGGPNKIVLTSQGKPITHVRTRIPIGRSTSIFKQRRGHAIL